MTTAPGQPPIYTRQAVSALARAVEAEHDFAGWLAAVLARVAAHAGSADALTAGRSGSWEAALVEQLVKGTVGYGDDEHLPDSDGLDDHDRPDLADMRAGLGTAHVILDGANPAGAHQAAESGSCPACAATAGTSFALNLAAELLGDRPIMSEGTRRVMLAAVEAAQRDLDAGMN